MRGLNAIKKVYDALVELLIFEADNTINIVEVQASGDMAFVRSRDTHGSVTERNTGKSRLPIFRELWVLRRSSGEWKIAVCAYETSPQKPLDPTAAVLW